MPKKSLKEKIFEVLREDKGMLCPNSLADDILSLLSEALPSEGELLGIIGEHLHYKVTTLTITLDSPKDLAKAIHSEIKGRLGK